jgi:acetolactate synthase-1/2/3 large subunit
MPVHVEANCDIADFLIQLNDGLKDDDIADYTEWLSQSRQWKDRYPVILPEYYNNESLVNTYVLVDILSELLDKEALLVPGSSGACAEVVQQAYRIKRGQRLLNTPGLGSMGFGLPAAIGACLASGNRLTISIIGDGGLQHNIQELETLQRLRLPIKILILNNNGYGSIKAMQETHFNSRYVCCHAQSGLSLPDSCRIASAYGLKSARIDNQQHLAEQLSEIIQFDGPVICDVLIDQNVPTSPRVSSQVLPDGSIVSKPMEDLWPFLSRDEFHACMHPAKED